MPRVLVTRPLPGDALHRLRAAGHEVDVLPGPMPPEPALLRDRVRDAEGLLSLLTDRIDAALLDAAPGLRVVANYAVGSDNVDLDACASRGVAVGVTPDVLTAATADLTWALVLAVARRLPEAAADARAGRWRTWEPGRWLGLELDGATLVVVGPGRIGRAVAHRAEAFGLRVLSVGRDEPLRPALARADVVTLHAPLTPQSRHLIDAAALACLRPSAILVNTARGGLVDQPALLDALRDGRLAGAGLDVCDPEPPAPDDPLLHEPRALVLPHVGSATHVARRRMAERCVDTLLAGLAGKPLPHPA